jgi:hypothetical protein
MKNIFNEHPHSIGETYWQHFFFASKFGSQMVIGGLACIIHAIFPFIFKKTASDYLLQMTNDFVSRMTIVEERVVKLGQTINVKVSSQRNHPNS